MVGAVVDNKRIAKNTIMLYFRMIFLMLIGLYTSRVNLAALGVDDFGIYNVVGGVVSMFSILSGSLSAAISRFITFELGTGNKEKLKSVFSSAVTIQILLAVIIVIVAEPVGLWFLNNKMTIPAERMYAANCVFQFSIVSFVIGLISVPYNAAIVAHEKMSAFAYIGIFEGLAKLAIAFLITISPIDKLIAFAGLLCLVSLLLRFIYGLYCKMHFEECKVTLKFDGALLKQMFGFAGWNFIGASSGILRDQGGSIILNMFFGPAVNAARGIAVQINTAVSGFVSNFMTALNPQITKSYARCEQTNMMSLVFRGARLSFYMLLILTLPVIFNIDYILSIWLKIVPEHTALFAQLTLILAMSESISNPLVTVMLATGDIKKYQIIVGGLQMLNLPIGYVCLKLWMKPESVLIVAIVISQLCLMARLILLKEMVNLSVSRFLKEVYCNILSVLAVAIIFPLCLNRIVPSGFYGFALSCVICLISSIVVIYFIGCTKNERLKVIYVINSRILKIIH
jgi:hypothetical protein